eukprot:12425016-Karenia_brevis.AAC.1
MGIAVGGRAPPGWRAQHTGNSCCHDRGAGDEAARMAGISMCEARRGFTCPPQVDGGLLGAARRGNVQRAPRQEATGQRSAYTAGGHGVLACLARVLGSTAVYRWLTIFPARVRAGAQRLL